MTKEIKIKDEWKNHPLFKEGKVELVSTEWVYKYRGLDPSKNTELKDGTIVDTEKLFQNILEEGLYDPLIMRVGVKNKKFRLEAGNHRIQALYKHGIKKVPLTVELREICEPNLSDSMTIASHNFDGSGNILISEIKDEYMKPSEVFKDLKK